MMNRELNPTGFAVESDIISRALALRKAKRIGIVLVEAGRYWIASSEIDPWGTRGRAMNIDGLRQLVELIEADLERKPVQRETGENGGQNSQIVST